MSIASRITSMSNHIENVYNEIKKFGVDLTSTNKNLENITNVLNDNIYSRLPQVDNSSDSSQLLNAQNGKVDEFKMYGNTEQDSYTGKNLLVFPYGATTKTENGITWTVNTDGSITVSGTASNISFFQLYNNTSTKLVTDTTKTYTLQIGIKSSNINLACFDYVNNNVERFRTDSAFIDYGITFTPTNNGTGQLFRLAIESGTAITTPITIYPIIIEGAYPSTLQTYEPFVGGTASPNPDYPQPIKVVTGTQTINVSGKNLLDKTNNIFQGTFYTSSGGNDSVVEENVRCCTKKINISGKTGSLTYSGQYFDLMSFYDSNNTLISYAQTSTALIPAGATSVRLRFYNNNNELPVSTLQSLNLMLENNSSATTYEPYYTPQTYSLNLGSLEFCEIGDYRDEIYENNGNWYKKSYIGKVVLDGSENWSARSFPDNSYLSIKMTLQPKENGGLCNYFISNNNYDIVNEHMTISKQWNELCFAILKSRLSTGDAAGFKNWLSTNTPIVYYILTTPTDTQITDTTLISQLETLSVFTGTNHFTISNTNNILPYIYVKRLKNLESLS